MRTISILLLTVAGGCKVVDAPETLEELVVFGFVNYDGGPGVREAFADGIRPHFEEFTEELEAGMRVDSLTADDLVDLGYRGEDEVTGIDVLGVTTRVAMRSTVDEIAEVITGDMSLVVDTTEVYETTPDGDRQCFLDHECDAFTLSGRRVTHSFLSKATQDFVLDFRWVTMSDGETALLFRSASPDPTETDSILFRVHEHYSMYALLPTSEGSEKLETPWIDAEVLGLELPDGIALTTAVQSIGNQAEEIDDFIDGGEE